jgi:CubicO group peptidase (beta-lactamase class C family)
MISRGLVLAVLICSAAAALAAQARQLTAADIERLRAGNIMTWAPADQRLGYPNIEKLIDTALVRRSTKPVALRRAEKDLSTFKYTYAGTERTLDEFMRALNVVGLIALKDGTIVLERYRDGHDGETKWTAFSVVKSVTSLLFGVALKHGHIVSLDEPVTKYLPELAATAYDGVSLRQLLQMSSGVTWNPNLGDKSSDTYQLTAIDKNGGFDALLKFMGSKPRAAAPGTKFIYNTADADLAGAILSRATKRSLAEYLTEHIWQPFGMEADGYWVKMRGNSGLEHGDCCLSATLRDYARLGLVALNDGVGPDGVRRLPEGWMHESISPSKPFPGYGYYWWLRKTGGYFASGSFGQHIEIDPSARVVVGIQSYWPEAYNEDLIAHNDALVAALIAALR